MGRSHALAGSQMPEADVPTLSLGDAKVISRSHLELRWDPAPPGRWILQAIGKNGFWIGTDTAHKIVPNGNAASEESKSEPPSIASTSTDTSCLYLSSRRATQFRIGLDKEAVLFWFLPVVPEPKKRTPKDPAAAAAAGTTGASEAKPKKRKAEDAEAAATLGPDGKPVKKRRKKASTAADVPASAAATSAGAPTAAAGAVIMVDDDPDMPPLAAH